MKKENNFMFNHLRFASSLARLLDNQFGIGKFRFGFDSVIGLVPGLGDLITLLLGVYILWIGVRLNLPEHKIAQMAGNLIMDFVLGAVPIIGDIADVLYKANIRNIKILEEFAPVRALEGKLA